MNKTFLSLIFIFLLSSGFIDSLSYKEMKTLGALSPQEFRAGKDYAIFFAVNEYNDNRLRDLQNPIKNARAMEQELEDIYGFEAEVIENPTLDRIESELKRLKDKFARNPNGEYQSDGQLFIFFSGHGVEENNTGFFLPKDADPNKLYRTGLEYSYWRSFINNIDCKHILVGIDACFSVNFDPGWRNRPSRNFGKRPGELSEGEKLLNNHLKYKSRLFFTADAQADETPDRSSFSNKLLEGLKSKGGTDGILTSSELFTYLEKASPKPHRGEFGEDEPGSSFLFMVENFEDGKPARDNTNEDMIWQTAQKNNTATAYDFYLSLYPNGKYRKQAQTSRLKLSENKNETSLPENWFLLDTKKDGIFGISRFEADRHFLGNKKSSPVTIAIINSGINGEDETLRDFMWVNPDEIPNNGIDDDKSEIVDDIFGGSFIEKTYDYYKLLNTDNHNGTKIAKVILKTKPKHAQFRLMEVRVKKDNSEVDYKVLDEAVRYAVDSGAKIIHIGFGTHQTLSDDITKAIIYAEKNDVLIVHAAGDTAEDNDLVKWYPNDEAVGLRNSVKNWLEVGASTASGQATGVSNYGGKSVDVFAPGTQIEIDGQMLLGTNMASAITVGTAAALLSFFPDLSAAQLKEIIMRSADKGKRANTVNKAICKSGGIVNLHKATELAVNTNGKRKRQ